MQSTGTVVLLVFLCAKSSEQSVNLGLQSSEKLNSDHEYFTSRPSYNVNDMWNHLVNYFRDNPTTETVSNDRELMQNDGVFESEIVDSEISKYKINLNSLDGLNDEQIWDRLTKKKENVDPLSDTMLSDENIRPEVNFDRSITKITNLPISPTPLLETGKCSECNVGPTPEGMKDLDEDYLNDLLNEKYQSDSPVMGPGDAKGSATLAFVFDSTGSMWDDLVQVKQGAAKIMATMLGRPDKPIYDYVLVPFHDPVIGPVTVTTNDSLLMQRLNEINVYGGGDCPEMTVGAVEQALQLSRPNSYIYVFTDARSKDFHLINQVLPLIQRKQSQVVFVMTGDCGDQNHPGYQVFQKIAATSSGQVYHLNKTDVEEVLTFVRVSLQSRKVNLLSVDRSAGKQNEDLPLPIDETLKEFTVSVSGLNASIGVLDPGGRQAVPPQVTPLLDLQNVKVVNVKEPNPGLWKLQVNSDSQHTVRSTGLSGSDFVFGFSVVPTFHMSETNHRPLKGAKNNVLVSATEPENLHNFTTLELTHINGTVAELIQLIPVPGKPGLYSGGPFVPPLEFFYLGVNGFARDKYPMKRITPTAISSQLPELPFVTMSPAYSGHIGHTLALKCNVESLVPFNVRWFKNGASKSTTLKYNQTAEVPLHLVSISKNDEGTYICRATNIAGTSYKETRVTVAGPPPEVRTAHRVTAVAGKPTQLDCNVKSDLQYNMTWDKIVQDGVKRGGGYSTVKSLDRTPRFTFLENNSLEIGPVLTSDEGWYTCTAFSQAGRASSKIYLELTQVPVARVYPRRSDFKAGSSFSIHCTFSAGIPQPTVRFKKDGQYIENSAVYKGLSSTELRIRNASRQDGGVYICEAQNEAGEGIDLAILTYTEPPEVTAEETTKLVKAGESVVLSCKITGTPLPSISWLKDGQHIPFSDSSRFKITDSRLEISPVHNTDAGQYTCVAENNIGTAQDFVELQVGTPPRLVQLPTDSVVPIGGSGSLLCTAIGLPVPHISWSRSGQQLDISRFEVSESGRLYIKGATVEDEGTYTCTVENEFGKEVLDAQLKITGIVPPKIKEGILPETIRVLIGDRVQLNCPIVDGNPPPTRTWYKDSNIVDENTIGAYITVETDGRLVINKIRPEDVGKYECIIRNVGGEDTLTVVIQTVVPPSVIADDSSPPQQKIILGGEVILQCPVQGDPLPTVYWLRNGNRLPHSSLVGSNLRLVNVTSDNRGDYICVATNPGGSANRTITLFVLEPPRILEWDESAEVTEGQEANLQCDIEAWPPAVISWFKDGQKLPFRTKYARFPANKTSEGRYTCVGENEVGTDQKHLDLFVSVPPAISTIPLVKAQIGSDVSLECYVVGDPKPQVYWLKYGVRLSDSLQTGNILHLANVSLKDGGNYECIAINSGGTMSASTHLDVLLPPKITQWEEKINAIENQELWLKCVVLKTHPPAKISWFKEEERLPFHSRHMRFTVNKTSEGRYSCLAENEGGSDRRYLNLFVAVRPKIVVNEDKSTTNIIQAITGGEVTLQCEIQQGDPFPQVNWLHNGKRLPESLQRGTNLHRVNLTTAESGNYVCTAGNTAGTDSISMTVDVLEPPKILEWRELVEVTEGRNIKLECLVAINISSTVKMSWFKDDNLLPYDTSSIRFVAKKEDQGRYSCLAENDAGSDQKYVDLFVAVPPEIEPKSSSYVKGIAGESVTLECFVKGDPTPQVSWIKDGVTLARQDESVNSLTMVNLTTANSGTYVCSAMNSAGSASQATSLTVLVGPKITEWEDDISVAAGEGVSLDCQVVGDPPIRITWFKSGDELPHHGRTLRFAAKAEDSGIYMCRAENEAGTDIQEATVSVLVPAFISPAKEETISIVSGTESEIRFVCGADGIPAPTVTWHKDSKNISDIDDDENFSFDGHDLIIQDITPDLAGVYVCDAENSAGIAQKKFLFEVYEQPKILDEFPTTVQLKEGDDYSIPCNAVGIPKPHISWRKGNILLASGHQDDDLLVMQDNTLVLTSLTPETGGVYSCVADNLAGVASRNYTIEVLVPPVTVDTSVTNIELVEADTGILTCPLQEAIPEPQIEWLKDGHPIAKLVATERSDDTHYNFKESGAVLKIDEVRPDDSGIYTCVATNVAGRSQAAFSVNVLVFPLFVDEYPNTDFTRVEGEELVLDCSVEGNPPPKVSWKRVELGLPVTEHTAPGVVVQIPLRRRLIIPSVQKHHAGTYQCTAVNKLGRESRQFFLNVIAQPELEGPAEETLEVVKGENITLHCRISGSPNPTMTWTFTNGDADIQLIENKGSEQKQLELANVTSDQGGIYICTGDNTAGSVFKLFNVTILDVPQISKSEFIEEVKVTAGGDLLLTCSAAGYPEPVMTWLRNGHVVGNSTKLVNNSHLLHLKEVHSRSGGKYSCVASNKAGVAEKVFKVKVLVPPKLSKQRWHSSSDTIASIEGLPLTIKCPVDGTPVPDIKWVKNDVPLNTEREMLHIGTAKKEHSGNYTCIATNNAGNFSKSFLVDVLVPPAFLDEEHAKYIRVLSNTSVQLNCSVRGHPHPSIMWVKGAEPIPTHLSNTTRLSNLNQTLELHAVDLEHSGRYSCLATNLAGAMEKTFHLEVLEPPSMDEGISRNDNVSEVKVVLHRKAVIECPLSGAPEPIISWYKEGNRFEGPQISQDGRKLHIMSSSPKDAGNYSCVAENQAGVKELLFYLTVVVPLEWTEWSEWTQCSVSCGGGNEERKRQCGDVKDWNLPGVEFDKTNCEGESFQQRLCSPLPCPVHGHWSEWSSWTSCSETCGRATRRRYRKCDSPAPALGGAPCSGSDAEQEYCFLGLCPVQAQWNEWSGWSKCSTSCGHGVMLRTRRCTRQDNGEETVGCDGRDRESSPCNVRKCPEDGRWSQWGEWSECSVTCGRGNRQRLRTCSRTMFGGKSCVGDNIQIEECRMYGCHKRSVPILKSAALKVKGLLNGEELEDTYIDADIRNDGPRRVVTATVQDILKQQAGWFPYLAFLLPPVSWTSATEEEDANNGYSLTNGSFTEESKFQFATGQELVVTHAGKGIDKDGNLKVEIEVEGNVPLVEPRATIVVKPYTEDYVQTGPSSLYANSRSTLDIDGQKIPFTWNKTVSYNSDLGTMPYLVERLSTRPLATEYNPNNQELKYVSSSEISRKYDEDRCPLGLKLDKKHQHCTDINECQENRKACHQTQICENQFGSYKCHCRTGFRMSNNGRRCVDINECKEELPCSHECQNTRGSYRCLCPSNYVLSDDGVTCQAWEVIDRADEGYGSDDDYYDMRGDYLESRQGREEIACRPGFTWNNVKCVDLDECQTRSHFCNRDQTCINLNGGYNCIDTPCIGDYDLDLNSGKCIQLCEKKGVICEDGATVAQMITYNVLPLSSNVIQPYQDITSLSPQGLKHDLLPRTVFRITENESGMPLRIRIENGQGIIYAMKYFNLQGVNSVTIEASSYGKDNQSVLFITKFVIFIYHPESIKH